MRGPKTVAMPKKKLDLEKMKPSNANAKAKVKATTEKPSKKKSGATKDSDAPKRPSGAFFIFMAEFRTSYKENFPDNKSVPVVGKAGGEKWKSMSDAEKAPYVAEALKRKAEYEKILEDYKKKANQNVLETIVEKSEESEKSTSEVHDEVEQEASS